MQLKALMTTSAAALMLIATGSQVNASIIASDDFGYADGTLDGQGDAGDPGWAESWRDHPSTGGFRVESGQAVGDGVSRTLRNLENSIDASTGGPITRITFNMQADETSNIHGVGFAKDGDNFGDFVFFYGTVTSWGFGSDEMIIGFGSGDGEVVSQHSDAQRSVTIDIAWDAGGAGVHTVSVDDGAGSVTFNTSNDLSFDRALVNNGFSAITTSPVIDNLTISAIPEPGSLALLGIGGSLMLLRRRKQ